MNFIESFKVKRMSSSFSNKKDSEAFSKFLTEELSFTAPVLPKLDNIHIERRLDSNSHIGFFLAQTLFKTMVSEAHLTHLSFNLDLLTFLKERGRTLFKRVLEDEVTYFFLYKDLVLSLSIIDDNKPITSIQGLSVFHSISSTPLDEDIKSFIIVSKDDPQIGLIKTNSYGPYVSWIDFNTEQKFSYDYYNDDFVNFVEDLTTKLTTTKSGLYLLHGEPGTGKSSSIKHIVSQIDRRFVFVAPQMVHCLSNPEFTNLVMSELRNAVLIIEDAEKALMARSSEDSFHNSELVSCILNLTDGIYADMTGTSIIATYNCERNLIDPALLRKGRLRSEYHFRKLPIEKSQKLMDEQGHDVEVKEEMTLADIFNYDAQFTNNKPKKRNVGFGV